VSVGMWLLIVWLCLVAVVGMAVIWWQHQIITTILEICDECVEEPELCDDAADEVFEASERSANGKLYE
jgi:hypothetical protein